MTKLDNVTIVAICHSDRFTETVRAMEYSIGQIGFARHLIITEDNDIPAPSSIEKQIVKHKITLEEYNRICIEELNNYIDTDYCLVIQWDGFVIDGSRWREQFLDYDYIGSPWIVPKIKNHVGNGGFSLRSKKYLQACSKFKYNPDSQKCEWMTSQQPIDMPIAPEDWFMCFNHYEELLEQGINFPDLRMAYKFSVEHSSSLNPFNYSDIKSYKSFGFHGDFNTAGMELLNVR